MADQDTGRPESDSGTEQDPNQTNRTPEDEPAADEELRQENIMEEADTDSSPEPHEVEEDFPQPEPPSSDDVSPVEPPPPHGAVRDEALDTGRPEDTASAQDEAEPEELTPLPPEEVSIGSFIKWAAIATGVAAIVYWILRRKN